MKSESRMSLEDLFVHRQDDSGSPAHLRPSEDLAWAGGDSSGPFALIRLAVLTIAPFILVDAALYQLQMLVTGGRAPITAAVLKIGLMAIFLAGILFRGRISDQPAVKIGLLFVVYLLIDSLHLYFNLGIDFADILLSYNAYYLLPLIAVLALCIPVKIPDRLLVIILTVLSVICGGLGIAQFLTNAPIVNTYSADGHFKVLVWSNLGHIRVFSLFLEPAACAVFFCFIASLAVAMSRRLINLTLAVPLLLLSVFMSWASGARTNIIATACGLISSAIIMFSSRKDRTKWLPLAWLTVGVVVAFYAYAQAAGGGLSTGQMTDASSFSERFATWSSIFDMFRSTSMFNLLFGYGLVQGEVLDPTGLGESDNLYLALVLHIGVIGLCLMMLLLWQLWQLVRREAEKRQSYLTTAVAATYSTLLLTGLFKITSLGMIFLFFAISNRASPSKHGEQTSGNNEI
jgi:hypothetical protein